MTHTSTARAFALAALTTLAAAPLAAQPTITDVTLWNAAANGAWTGGWWNTRPLDGTYNLFLTTQPDAAFNAASVVNPSATISRTLGVGTHTFYFYSTTSASTYYGLNLFFGGSVTPGISAVNSLGGTFAAIAASVPNTESPTAAPVPGAGTLTYTSGAYTVTLTAFDILGTASGAGEDVNRVSPETPTPDFSLDNYGRIVLQVTGPGPSSSVPEPSTWVMLATGGLAVAGIAARKRRA